MDNVIVKNSAWLFAAQVLVKIISFVYVIFLARSLGVANFGLYIAALSYFSLFSSIADLGITRFLTREVAIDKQKLGRILSTAIAVRLVVLLTLFIVFALFISIFDPDMARKNLSILAVLAVVPQSISLSLDAAFVASFKVKFSALGMLLLSIFTATSGVTLIYLGFGPMGAVLGLLFGQLLFTIAFLVLASWQKMNFWQKINKPMVVSLAKGSLPYALLAVLGLLYFKIDALLLSYLKGSYDTGIYGAAYKFLEAIVFIPTVFFTGSFPFLAKYHQEGIEKVEKVYYQSLKILVGLGILIMLGYIFILPIVIKLLLPQYIASISVIKILSLTIPFMFANSPAVLVLFSTDKFLKSVILLSLVTLAFNIILNLILIPPLGYIGASIVTILSEILSFIVFYLLLRTKVFQK